VFTNVVQSPRVRTLRRRFMRNLDNVSPHLRRCLLSIQSQGPSDRVDHHTPESHRCGSCRSGDVDCDHLVPAMPINHVDVTDGWIKSLSYERRTGRLEIHFIWNDVRQFWPISPVLPRQLGAAGRCTSCYTRECFRIGVSAGLLFGLKARL
jgi:hypothetical protein